MAHDAEAYLSGTTYGHEEQEALSNTPKAASCEETIEYEPVDAPGILGLEDIQKYNKGGYHPVQLDDVLDGRFEVVHKLGSGGFGIVWLCRDTVLGKWRAVKVMTADSSSEGSEEMIFSYLREQCTSEELAQAHIVMPLEQFWLEGPNGRHRCLVMPVLGWTVSNWRLTNMALDEQTLEPVRDVCRQVVEAMGFLHRHGICHGDFKPDNILMKVDGIDGLDKDQIIEMLGEQEVVDIKTLSGQPTPRAPEYSVIPSNPFWCESITTTSIALVDFGESYFSNSPPVSTGIPSLYAAPEVLFQNTEALGTHSDIWALACTLYHIWTWATLFSPPFGSNLAHIIDEIEFFLGPLPREYAVVFREMLRSVPWATLSASDQSTQSAQPTTEVAGQKVESEEESKPLTREEELAGERAKFIEKHGYSDVFEAELGRREVGFRKTDGENPEPTDNRNARDDVLGLADLLRNMLKYNPSERINTNIIMSHPWIGADKDNVLDFDGGSKPTISQVVVMVSSVLAFTVVTWNIICYLPE